VIVIETIDINGSMFAYIMIRKVGTDEIYSEAYDVLAYTYKETNTQIDISEIS